MSAVPHDPSAGVSVDAPGLGEGGDYLKAPAAVGACGGGRLPGAPGVFDDSSEASKIAINR